MALTDRKTQKTNSLLPTKKKHFIYFSLLIFESRALGMVKYAWASYRPALLAQCVLYRSASPLSNTTVITTANSPSTTPLTKNET